MICSNKYFLILLSLFAGIQLFAAPPVPFSGKLAVDGTNFHGNALFSFSIVDDEGTVHWKHADEANSTIENFVMNGRYLVLLGGQGMQTLPADLFLQHESLFLRVSVDLKDGQGKRLLEPDQRITSSPYALSAEIARLSERAHVAGGVDSGAITADMLEQALLADLNRTFELGLISRDMLEQGVRDELNASITLDRLSAEVRADLNRTIGITNLSSEVTEKLNREFIIEPGSIGKALLAQDVRDDLNRTITRESLSQDIIADLNRTVRLQDLSEEVSQSINRPITREMLAQDVRDDLNRTITLSDLDSLVIAELNDTVAIGSISLIQLSQGVRDELNATITRDRLSADIRADLNRTIGIANLSTEVTDKLNQTFSIDVGSITLDQLSQQVRDDINSTITRDRLSSDVLSDINRTITKSMLSQEVLNELNATIGPSKLSSEVSNALKPVVIGQPSSVVGVSGTSAYLTVGATGGDNTYQWKKNGADIVGATSHTLSITDLNASQHEGNYTVVVSNAFGSVTSSVAQIDVSGSLTEGLVGWWKFDETEGNIAYDSSGNGNDGNLTNGPTWTEGKIGGALNFDGVDDYVVINSSNEISFQNNFTLCSWLKVSVKTDDTSDQRIISKGSYDYDFKIYGQNRIAEHRGKLEFGGNSLSGKWVKSSLALTDNTWTQVAGSSIQNQLILFINGQKVAEQSTSVDFGTSENKLLLGGEANRAYLLGLLDDVRIYDRALSAVEVKALYELGEGTVQEIGSGTPTVQAEVADGSIGPSKLSSEVSNALKPVVIGQPSSVVGVSGTSAYLTVGATGGDNAYQWKKDGVDIAGATGSVLSITDLNASQHEGNYTVVVSNAFGSTTSSVAQIDVNGSLSEGLVGWWKFDETEGTVASDSSGNGNDGTLTNGPTWTEGKFGGALNFDGENDLLKLPSTILNGITDFSASFHFLENLNNTDHHHFISVANASTANRFILGLESNYEFNINDSITGASLLNYQSTHNFINWSPIAVSRNSSTTKLFISGILVSYASHSGDSLTISENGLWVGGDQDSVGGGWGATQQLNGSIDDLRIYDRALTAFEIKSLHELGEQPVQESGSGTTAVVNGTVADGSITASKIADQTITTNQLSEQILKYLKPEITQQPTAGTIYADTNHTFSVSAEGKYLTYQWKKNGVNLAGETNATLTITDANSTQHDGNYSVVVSNDFGSVESGELEVLVTDMILDGLVGWWKFDETSGTVAYDSSGNGNNGNLANGPTWVTGKIGGALSFDGVDDYFEVSSRKWGIDNLLSLSLWYKIESTTSGAAFSLGSSQLENEILLILNPNIKFYHHKSHQNWALLQTSSQISLWSHFVGLFSNGFASDQMKLFINGNSVNAEYSTSGSPALLSDIEDRKLKIGHRVNNSNVYKGLIDDVRIYDRVLSTAEVQALYQLGQ